MKKQQGLRLTEEGKRILETLALANGISQAAVIEQLLRQKSKEGR
jgi:hypothetical protein